MDIKDLIYTIVSGIVPNKDAVLVKVMDEKDDITVVEVIVDKDDYGIIIGKSGKMINSINQIVDASCKANNLKKVRINIDKF